MGKISDGNLVLRLFQSVAQCCMGQKQAQQVMEGTGAS